MVDDEGTTDSVYNDANASRQIFEGVKYLAIRDLDSAMLLELLLHS